MKKSRIAIIVLVVLAALFALGVGFGIHNDDKRPVPAPSWSRIMGTLLEPLSPKLERDEVSKVGNIFKIAASRDGSSFRKATFTLKQGEATITYNSYTKDDELEKQTLELPDESEEKPREGSLIILKDGGTLTVDCERTPCRLYLWNRLL